MTKAYNKGKKAKEILNIYKNPYLKGTEEHSQFKKGFNEGVYEPLNYGEDLDGDKETFIDEFEPLKIVK